MSKRRRPCGRIVKFRCALGAEQATIPAPDGNHMRHHEGRKPTTCHMLEADYKTWKSQWGYMVEILSEEVTMKYRVTLAEGEGFLSIPWPRSSNRVAGGRTRLREDKPMILDMTEQEKVNIENIYKSRVKFEPVDDDVEAEVSSMPHDDKGDEVGTVPSSKRLKPRGRGKQPKKPKPAAAPKAAAQKAPAGKAAKKSATKPKGKAAKKSAKKAKGKAKKARKSK